MQRALYSYRGGTTDPIAIVAGTRVFAQAFWVQNCIGNFLYSRVYIGC
jgi:hypothetical protein